MANAYGAGKNFTDYLAGVASRVKQAATYNPFDAAAPAVGDFLAGAFGAPPPAPPGGVVVPLPAPMSLEDRAAHVANAVGSSLVGQGTLTPAAAAALQNAGAKQNFVQAPAKGKGKSGADQLDAFKDLSFRQLLALSQASQNVQPRGTTRTPTAADLAGAQLASIYQQQFSKSLSDAGNDPAKQKAAIDAFEQKMLPLALKGNTADEYLYGQGAGAQ